MNKSLAQMLNDYETAKLQLEYYREVNFPAGMEVHVECDRYHGKGIAVSQGDCPLNQLPVLLENGNVWWYPLKSIS